MVSEFIPVLNRFHEIGAWKGFAQVGEAMKEFGPAALPGSKLTIYTGEQIGDGFAADGVTYHR